jgi:LPXTG-motif cell wall-anchored protein
VKFLATTVVLMILAANPTLPEQQDPVGMPLDTTAVRSTEYRAEPADDPELALAIFGVALLGAIGLLWVRRNNSEL